MKGYDIRLRPDFGGNVQIAKRNVMFSRPAYVQYMFNKLHKSAFIYIIIHSQPNWPFQLGYEKCCAYFIWWGDKTGV